MISARAADAVRKVSGYALATAITLLLFRVLGRTAHGSQSWRDPELAALVALLVVGVTWVRAAKRVRRAAAPPEPAPEPASVESATSGDPAEAP